MALVPVTVDDGESSKDRVLVALDVERETLLLLLPVAISRLRLITVVPLFLLFLSKSGISETDLVLR